MQFDVKVEEGDVSKVPTPADITLQRLVKEGKISLTPIPGTKKHQLLVDLQEEGEDNWVRSQAQVDHALIGMWNASGGEVTLPVKGGDGKFYNFSFTPEIKKKVRENGDISYNVTNVTVVKPRRKAPSAFADAVRQAAKTPAP